MNNQQFDQDAYLRRISYDGTTAPTVKTLKALHHAQLYTIPFENFDIHIHVPAGAIPKDGPSAGIAMATALISTLANKVVRSDVAMTGEITLRGRVLPVGGLKEKALGAMRAGIRTIIVPEKNKKELSELPRYMKRRIEFVPVKQMSEVMEQAMIGTKVKDKDNPFELVRIVRAFDPCLACSVHLLDFRGNKSGIFRVV